MNNKEQNNHNNATLGLIKKSILSSKTSKQAVHKILDEINQAMEWEEN